MRYVYLAKNNLDKFVKKLQNSYRVVAPVKKENQFVFADITDPDEICLDYIPTILPPKKYFLPQKEVLGEFNLGEQSMKDTAVEITPTVIFAAHTCDIDGLECLDHVFHSNPIDPYFAKRKKMILIIGYECMKPCDDYATCIDMDTHIPKAGYDIMITDAGDQYILHANSSEGNNLLSKSEIFKSAEDTAKSELRKLRQKKIKEFIPKFKVDYKHLYKVFENTYKSDTWEDIGKRCVSCGNCTAVCPTCYCFDVFDSVDLDVVSGTRNRTWDSCQLDEFAAVAGGESFREERSSRQRHRYYRKFNYPIKKFNKFFCTGCGRCTRTCMAKISLTDTVNSLAKEYKNAK